MYRGKYADKYGIAFCFSNVILEKSVATDKRFLRVLSHIFTPVAQSIG